MTKRSKANPWTEEEIVQIAGMYRAGVSSKDIVRRFDTTPAALKELMGSRGIYRTLNRRPVSPDKRKRTLTNARDNASEWLGNREQPAE